MLTNLSDDLLPGLCAHIVMGGSPIDYCQIRNVSYCDLIAWIYADPAREKKYSVSLHARTEWLIQRVLLELRRLAFVDIRDAYNSDGTLMDVKKLSADLAACISSIQTEEIRAEDGTFVGYTKKIKLWDKKEGLKLLGTHLALFIERHDHSVHGQVQIMPTITVDDKPLRYDIGQPPRQERGSDN